MAARDHTPLTRSATLRSPALYLGELVVVEGERSHGRAWLSGTRLKSLAIPALHWSLRHLPVAVAMAQVQAIVALLRLMYWRRWPLRLACERLCRLAAGEGKMEEACDLAAARRPEELTRPHPPGSQSAGNGSRDPTSGPAQRFPTTRASGLMRTVFSTVLIEKPHIFPRRHS